MSIDSSACLILGLPYKDLVKLVEKDIIDNLIHDDILQISHPYYDSEFDQGIIGKTILYSHRNLLVHIDKLEENKNKAEIYLNHVFNTEDIKYSLYLCPDVM